MRTVISRRSVHEGLLSAVLAGSLFLGATGCGGDGDNDGLPKDYKVVAGTQLCGGRAISADAAKALKVITGASRFEASSKNYTVARAASDLVVATPGATVGGRGDACRVFKPTGTRQFQLRITWRRAENPPTDEPAAAKFTVLKMGDETLAAADMAYVYFTCRSDKLAGSGGGANIVIGVEHWAVAEYPEENVKALKDAYATVAHSFSLAMAKELRCENNGGLPAKPVLDPA
ncbi:hypothetical protein [Streptomyces sp. NPDC004286]|uniref:hypothetical protein n=1 Tax=Streptomyces sp. NPDC004286 TaxID=3364696 RepID=UPI003698D692